MKIHREGISIIFIALSILITLLFFFNFFFVCWLLPLFFFIIFFFRNPHRRIKNCNDSIFSPADGRVIKVEKTFESEYFKEDKIQISIFMSPLNVHVNRNPITGVVNYFKYHKGKYLVAFHPKSSEKNERTTIVIKNNLNNEILFRQIAGFIARRIKYYDHQGKEVNQGSECGFIKFGSRADIFLPLNSKIKVEVGDKAIAGITKIAEW
jgi:phosphatidylserine decarboxylase